MTEDDHADRRQHHGRNGQRLQRQFLREHAEQRTACRAAHVSPGEHPCRSGGRETHVMNNGRHPLQDEVESCHMEEVRIVKIMVVPTRPGAKISQIAPFAHGRHLRREGVDGRVAQCASSSD